MTRFWNNKNVDIKFSVHDPIYIFIIPETRHAHYIWYLRLYYSRNGSCALNLISTFLLFQKRVMRTKFDKNVEIKFSAHDPFLE
jgi:hypothetical protein